MNNLSENNLCKDFVIVLVHYYVVILLLILTSYLSIDIRVLISHAVLLYMSVYQEVWSHWNLVDPGVVLARVIV